MLIQKMFFWIGLFLCVGVSSCAYAKSDHKKSEHHEEQSNHANEQESDHTKKSEHHDNGKNKHASSGNHGTHWAYEGKMGPAHWGEIASEYRTCKSGKKQSPINITHSKTEDMNNIRFHYKPSKLNIVNNGHTIQVDYDKGSFIRIGGIRYDLLQFHFHTPSEHTIEEGRYPMELHLVHKNKKGELAVVGLMMVIGRENSLLSTLWDNLPPKKGKENLKQKIDVATLLPAGERTFRYPGSLTTPPCSEGVLWNVFLSPISISNDQFTTFYDIFENNSRPIQQTGKRVVLEDSTP
jgi:carbonic anhydrase